MTERKTRRTPLERECVSCGKRFVNESYHRRKTCSPACHSSHQSRMRKGRKNPQTPAAMARIAEMGRRTIETARAAAAISPRAGQFETHHEAKIWLLQSPEGVRHEVRNLNHFCRAQFGAEWRRYSSGLNNHARWVRGTSKCTYSHYRGWRILAPAESPDHHGQSGAS